MGKFILLRFLSGNVTGSATKLRFFIPELGACYLNNNLEDVRTKKLKEVGFTEQQAEVQAEAMAELVNEQLATKRDLKELEMSLVLRLGGIMVAGIAVIATLVKIL